MADGRVARHLRSCAGGQVLRTSNLPRLSRFYEEAAGAESIAAPEDLPWGERVAQVRDPDGNLLYVATPTVD
ncbi:VOC family protein [Microbacterium sp. CR_7]|uniref:VOC family protein n=1 Tax=Microbacterium sp. CR_7 TaxID=3055792 RepID=UPI0035BFA32B